MRNFQSSAEPLHEPAPLELPDAPAAARAETSSAGGDADAAQPSTATARIGRVNLGRIAWVLTVLACLVAVLILVLDGYYGYAGVTLAVAVSAAINIV